MIQLNIGLQLFQLMTATQWYCPPAVGYADKNSANDAAKAKLHIPAVISPQSTEVEPPLGNASDNEADNAVQEFRIANARPSMDRGEKFRFNSCLTPSAARCCWSSMLLRLRPAAEPCR